MFIQKASKLFSTQEISSIETAIGDAEQKISAEIVPVIATVSGRYDRAKDLFGFTFALICLGCSWGWLNTLSLAGNEWSEPVAGAGSLTNVLTLLVASFLVWLTLARYFPVLRVPFISKREMQSQVELSARDSFQRLRIRKTEGSSSILIYISLYERMVHVVGDDAVNAKLSNAGFKNLCDTVIDGLKRGTPKKRSTNGYSPMWRFTRASFTDQGR